MAEVHMCLPLDWVSQTDDQESIEGRLCQIRQSVLKRKLFFSVVSSLAGKRRRIARVENSVENVIPQYTPDDFRNRFRMGRSTCDALVLNLSHHLAVGDNGGIMKVSVEKQLLIFIRYASCQQILTEIADHFGVCEATVHTIVHRTSSIICSDLLPALVKWPSGMKVQETVDKFFQHKGFPGVLGAIDGSHIPIKTPKVDGEQYYNRK